jgi:hypothetical protein
MPSPARPETLKRVTLGVPGLDRIEASTVIGRCGVGTSFRPGDHALHPIEPISVPPKVRLR